MPLYDYQCAKCGAVFEVRQKFSDPELKEHEGCGGAVTKLLSAPAFHLKGSGWYITDYAKSGSGPAKTESAESKSESKPAETKTETKTETKSESKSESSPASTSTKSE